MKRRIAAALLIAVAGATCHLSLATRLAAEAADDEPKRSAKQQSGPRVFKGRAIAPVMTAAGGGAEWLEREDRDATEQPDKVIEALKIPAGSVVADVGAGTGYFSIRIAKKIGPDGKVLATDVQSEMLRQLREFMKKTGVKNIEPILATADDARLPQNKVDLVLMVDVYHELQDPERTMAQIRKSLKAGGRLVLVEYRGEDPSVPIKPEHKTTLRQILYEIEPMGFRLKEVFEFLPHQHVEVFVKDDVAGEDVIIDPMNFPIIRKPGWSGVESAEPYEQVGFTRLFNGEDLSGWKGNGPPLWRVHEGAIVGNIQGNFIGIAELSAEKKFDDFELDLKWRLRGTDAFAGVIIRGPFVQLEPGVPHVTGYPKLLAARKTGEVYFQRIVQRTNNTANALVLPGEWNRLTARCAGRRIQIAINGVPTGSFEVAEDELTRSIGLHPARGGVEFREIWVKKLGKQD